MDENKKILVGKFVVVCKILYLDKIVVLFKCVMGSNIYWYLGEELFNVLELFLLVLCLLKEDVEDYFQQFIKDVVILVLVYFSDEQCKYICFVVEFVGLNVVCLINEFMVVVMVYGLYMQ